MSFNTQATHTSSGNHPAITSHLPQPNAGLEVPGKLGTNVLFVVFVAMLVATVCFFGAGLRKPKSGRGFEYITGFITLFAAISYYSMSVGLGQELLSARGPHAVRAVLTPRYYDWLCTTPLLLLDLGLLAGLIPLDIILLIVFDLLMILTGYFAAITVPMKAKIGFYAMSCVFLLVIFGILFINGNQTAKGRGDKVSKAYKALSVFTAVLWSLYPVVWMLSEGLNFVHSDTEIIAYAVLDVMAKPVFGGALLFLHSKIEDSEATLPEWMVSNGDASYSSLPTHE